jgi:hypothetical protein
VSSAYYRLLSPGGAATEEGSADAAVADGAFVLTPSAGDVLRVPFSQIASVADAEQFTLRVALAQGTMVELSRLGAMRTQLLAELRDGFADAAASTASVVGKADSFSAIADGQQVELRIYDDALLIVGPAGAERVSFCFVQDVQSANYVIAVQVAGRSPVELTRLGNRTGEFTDALRDRLTTARNRTSAFLGSLLPGLDPMALRQAAGLLRDGVAVPATKLNAIHPELADTLIRLATLPERVPAIAELTRGSDLAVGFRQIASVHKEAVGVTEWQDHSASPHIGQHESHAGSFRTGFAGMMAAGLMSGAYGAGGFLPGGGFGGGGFGGGGFGPGGFGQGGYGGYGGFGYGEGYGGYGDYWAYRAIGAGMTTPQQHQMTQRADVTRGRLTPASEDLSALTATGEDPTVLAFVLASTGDRVIFEILNMAEPATLVFRGSGPDAVAGINRALVDSGFTEPAPEGDLARPARPAGQPVVLAEQLVGQVPHDAQWFSQVRALLSG